MAAPHLTLAIASSALFDLSEADAVYRAEGIEAYRRYQRSREDEILPVGVAFPFIRRLLTINRIAPDTPLVEVVLISRNDPDTGVRVHNSLDHYKLHVERSVFTGGRPPYHYIDDFAASLFLSANQGDVEEAIRLGYPAGRVLGGAGADDDGDELRLAFDFDGVLADDASERIYQEQGLAGFRANERDHALTALSPGPLKGLLTQIAQLQDLEAARSLKDPGYKPLIRTSIITARSGAGYRRVISSLRAWGIRVDESCFIGDMPKDRVIRKFRPHLFFDDKLDNALLAANHVPSAHVPFGISNRAPSRGSPQGDQVVGDEPASRS
jgi:5'-nucleotidase